MTTTVFADDGAFVDLEKEGSRATQDFFMFFIVNSATTVVMRYALDPPKQGLQGLDEVVRAEFGHAISSALLSRTSSYYRFFKRIEPECKPLCFAKFADLTATLVRDVMQNAGVEEVLALTADEINADYQTYFALVKTVAVDFIKYFFMIKLPDIVCSRECSGPGIDDIAEKKARARDDRKKVT